MTFRIPIRTVNITNRREHWATRAKRTRQHRWLTRHLCEQGHAHTMSSPLSRQIAVTLTRIAPRAMDGDGLQAALKAVRDGVADALRMDDGDPRVAWRYAQERGKPREYAVRIEIDQL